MQNEILKLAESIFQKAGVAVSAQWVDEPIPRILVSSTEDLAPFIGAQGSTLMATEHLLKLLVSRSNGPDAKDFVLDINNYRKSQSAQLIALARTRAQRVSTTGQAESLAPMNSYERKVIHTELASFTDVITLSIGTEPNRRIVIKPSLKI